MSSATWADEETFQDFVDFLRQYYREEVATLAQTYPQDTRSLEIDYTDLFTFSPEHADRFVENRQNERGETVKDLLESALGEVDLPIPASFESREYQSPHVRVQLPAEQTYGVGEVRDAHRGQRVAVSGQIERVTKPASRFVTAVFVCQRCGYETVVPQSQDDFQEPYECESCERQGPFQLDPEKSESVDHVALKLKEPPEVANGSGSSLVVYVEDDLLSVDGRRLTDCSGERAKISGVLQYDLSDTEGSNARPVVGEFLEAEAITLTGNRRKDIDIDEHRAEFEELAGRDDAFELLRDSIAPSIYGGENLQQVLAGAVLFLFGGYRKAADGEAYRGDIHLFAVGDPGTGKSTIAENVAELSPHCEVASGTNVTGVGLTAAAEQDDDFGNGTWTLKPGLLPKANGGHAVLDEIDKMPAGAAQKLHDALEGQRLNVNKAGVAATFQTEAGLFTAGNPKDGRFDPYEPIPEQIDIDPALFSRFDLIFVLRDTSDPDLDREIAEHMVESWSDLGARTRGDDIGESGVAGRPVSAEVIRAWVAYARENLQPRLPDGEVRERLIEFYTTYRAKGEDGDPAITARKLEAGLRLAEASARANLREEITMEDVERAISLTERVVEDVNSIEGESEYHADADTANGFTQLDRVQSLKSVLDGLEPDFDDGVPLGALKDALDGAANGDPDRLDRDLERLKEKGIVYEPSAACYRLS